MKIASKLTRKPRCVATLLTAALLTTACAAPQSHIQTQAQTHQTPWFDTHTHFFTDDTATYPLHAAHAYMGEKVLTERVMSHPDTPARMFSLWNKYDVEGGIAVQYNAAYESDNRYVLSVAHQYPQRITPVVMLDLTDPATPATLRKLVTQDGAAGLRMPVKADADGSFPWLDSAAAHAIWQTADSLHLPVIVFTTLHGPRSHELSREIVRHVLTVARQYPNVPIVIDHCGWPDVAGAPDFGIVGDYRNLASVPNVYLKVTTINFEALAARGIPTDQFMRHLVDTFGAKRIMWGSDFGNTQMPYEAMVADAQRATALLTDEEKRQVLHDTGRSVFVRG